MREPQVEDQIWRLKEASGSGTDKELADELGVNPSSVAAWRRRGKVPEKYMLRAAITQARDFNLSAPTDEFSVHVLAFFIDLIGREDRLRFLPASDELNLLFVARLYFALEQHLRQEAAGKRATTLEQRLAVLERFREQYAGHQPRRRPNQSVAAVMFANVFANDGSLTRAQLHCSPISRTISTTSEIIVGAQQGEFANRRLSNPTISYTSMC